MEQNIYDNKDFFNGYENDRKDDTSANDLIEIPQLFNLIGGVKDKTILNLGCGAGGHNRKLASLGAKSILGIDISNNMIEVAKNNNTYDNVSYKVMSMNKINELNQKFDLVVSSLAIHYIEDYEQLCKNVYNLLNDGGEFIYSCGHPMDSAVILNDYQKNHIELNNKTYYLLSDYNNEGKRVSHWYVDDVITYHRNISTLVNGLINAGFTIERMEESYASEEAIKKNPKYANQKDHSYFIFFKAKKN